MTGMKNIKAITLDEADKRYGLCARFGLDDACDDDEVVLVEGPAELHHLPLDFRTLDSWTGLPKRSPGAFLGVVVDGDLSVTDRVVNKEWDFGPFLLVRGDVRAKNFATAGSEVLIEGGLAADQTILGTYNHGRTVVRGQARAEVVFSEQHLIEFHGSLTAELVVSCWVHVADPEKVRVNGWVGNVRNLSDEIIPQLGAESTRALRALDPGLWHNPDSREILKAVEAGRSLLRTPESRQPGQPRSCAERIREILQQAGCREADPWDDGFWIRDRGDAHHLEVSFCMADEPDTSADAEPLDEAAEVRRYAEVLAAAGVRVTVDPHDEDILHVRP
ncbi:hypothetical protein [Rhizohabitans arisaemae]|uniref:hypothetical protein n=1 Tax=Rhizohabitans arisaemae TaxID=2720610 RepID=UPI0024B17656|nr:hypothetical protein [Rhizohabitans arisaemae]